jgi:hypothetical protein
MRPAGCPVITPESVLFFGCYRLDPDRSVGHGWHGPRGAYVVELRRFTDPIEAALGRSPDGTLQPGVVRVQRHAEPARWVHGSSDEQQPQSLVEMGLAPTDQPTPS